MESSSSLNANSGNHRFKRFRQTWKNVYGPESRAIKTNQDLLPTTPIGQLFYNDFWGTPLTHSGSHKSYRPLCVLTFRLNYALGGLDPWGYHFFNVILHAMVSALFTSLASALFCHSTLPTLAASLLFAAHPIHTEAVAGVVGRADVGACFFFLLALLSYMKYCKYRDKKQYLYICLVMSAASMLTKEHGITVLVLCAVYDLFVVHRLHPRDFLDVLNQKENTALFSNPSLKMEQLSHRTYGNLANILSFQGKKAEAEWAYKKALTFRANMADVHYNLGILQQEQYRYEEALVSYKLAIQFRPRLAMAHLNLGLVLGIMGRRTEAEDVYRHCASLDSSGLKDPKMHETTKISALFNLGRLQADSGKYELAIETYLEAVEKMPEHYQPQSLYNMLGEAYFKLKQYDHAERWYQQALRAKSDHIPAHLTYAKLLSKWGRENEAEKWFLKAKVIAPNDSSVYQHYGQFLSENERHVEAAEVYLRAAELAPDEYEIVFNAANALRQAGRNEDAEHYYQVAVKLRPQEVGSHMNLGAMLHVNGKLQEAEKAYLEALRLKPDDHMTQNNLQKLRILLSKSTKRNDSRRR
ncbi:protein O-mannosyl-transferase TMTC2 [Trichonephila inaurata madagascariensis]|uniref:Protein O-mannosyl-transferase TMTC2 n=1 Tax=Trichonephila inaurata madagascariensis TaxID=2747483 RepID=A0A8X6XFC8_9ARAC|nr:protein O-mannosyl-transferase TMTC2 [Trichonephila inaurata madagascariensis]